MTRHVLSTTILSHTSALQKQKNHFPYWPTINPTNLGSFKQSHPRRSICMDDLPTWKVKNGHTQGKMAWLNHSHPIGVNPGKKKFNSGAEVNQSPTLSQTRINTGAVGPVGLVHVVELTWETVPYWLQISSRSVSFWWEQTSGKFRWLPFFGDNYMRCFNFFRLFSWLSKWSGMKLGHGLKHLDMTLFFFVGGGGVRGVVINRLERGWMSPRKL